MGMIRPAKTTSAQQMLGIEEIHDGILYTSRRQLISFLRVRSGDCHLLSDAEVEAQGSALTAALAGGSGAKPWQILSIPRTVDTEGMMARLAQRRSDTDNTAKQMLLDGELAALERMTESGAKEPLVLIKCWQDAAPGADELLMQRMRDIRSKLESDCAASAEILTDQEIRHLCRLYTDLTGYHTNVADPVEPQLPTLPGRKKQRRSDAELEALALQELVPMGGMDFGVNRVAVGPTIGRIYGATRYPAELDYGWAVDLINAVDSVVSITYDPGDAAQLGDALSRSIAQNASTADAARDARRRMQLERQIQDAGELLQRMDFGAAAVGHMSIMVMPFTDQEDKLPDVCRSVCSRWARRKIKLKPLANVQRQAWQALSPYFPGTCDAVDGMLRQIMPLESLAGGFPLTVTIYRDDGGAYFARSADGGIMSIDFLRRDADRANVNLVVVGESGQGKSTAVKHLVQMLYMLGVRVLILDPEREYKSLCHSLGGCWLDVGGGQTIINPLQVRPAPRDEEDTDAPDNALALHIFTMEIFFSLLYPGLDQLALAALKRVLVECYQRKGITWDTDVSSLTAQDYPIMADLYDAIRQHREDSPAYADLEALVYDLAHGAAAHIFNGLSNYDDAPDFMVFDTFAMTSSSDTLKRAQYFNALSLCWQIMSHDRTEPVLLVADEAHLMMDPSIAQTAMYLRNIAKRCRKYEGMLFTIFQQTADMLYPEIRMYGQAILDNATYKLLFGCDGQNLADTADVCRLTEQEQQILLQKRKRRALAIIGREHVQVEFDLPDYKLKLMGTGGGR